LSGSWTIWNGYGDVFTAAHRKDALTGRVRDVIPHVIEGFEAYCGERQRLGTGGSVLDETRVPDTGERPPTVGCSRNGRTIRLVADVPAIRTSSRFGATAAQATWRELDAWVRGLGVDPMTAIRKATLDAARHVGADRDSGSIAEGKLADVIAVAGNPLRHIDVLREPAIVIKHGRRYK
jgi:hypothetical protein